MRYASLTCPSRILAVMTLIPLLSSNAWLAPSQRPLRPVHRWTESWDTSPRVSGALAPGLMVGDQSATYPGGPITVRLPERGTPAICVTITGRDGQFQANALFSVASLRGSVPLEGPRRYRRQLRGYQVDDVAIRAEAGNSCGDPSRVRVAANWGGAFQGGDVYLYVNSRQHTSVAWSGRGGEPLNVHCIEREDERSIAYNRVCRIPADRIPDRSRLTILRQRDGRTVVRDTLVLDYAR
jgi:hypothetical protein